MSHPYVSGLLAAFPPTSAPSAQATASQAGPRPGPDLIESLTRREAEILQLLDARLSIKEIAASLDISSETARRHTRAIYQKLMIGTRRAAVARAQALGLLTPAPPGPVPQLPDARPEGECR